MPSTINPNIPQVGDLVLSTPVRNNFLAARDDFNGLETTVSTKIDASALNTLNASNLTSGTIPVNRFTGSAPIPNYVLKAISATQVGWAEETVGGPGTINLSGVTNFTGTAQSGFVLKATSATEASWQAESVSAPGITALTGDVTASGTGSVGATVGRLNGTVNIASTGAGTVGNVLKITSANTASWQADSVGGVVNTVNVTAPITGGGTSSTISIGMTSPLPTANGGTGTNAANLDALKAYLGVGAGGFPADGSEPFTGNFNLRTPTTTTMAFQLGGAFPAQGTTLGEIRFQGWTGPGAFSNGGWINCVTAAAWNATNRATNMALNVTNALGQGVQGISIRTSGATSFGSTGGMTALEDPQTTTNGGNGWINVRGILIVGTSLVEWIENTFGINRVS